MSNPELVQPTDLCSECGEFVPDGHMLNCSNWRLGQRLSWVDAVCLVLEGLGKPLSAEDLVAEVRRCGYRVFRTGSVSAQSAVRRALASLIKAGVVTQSVRPGHFVLK
jgi:hypothetical protein